MKCEMMLGIRLNPTIPGPMTTFTSFEAPKSGFSHNPKRINIMVFVGTTPYLLPCANRPHSLLKALSHINGFFFRRESNVSRFPL